VYRATISGGPYTLLNSSLVPTTQYNDANVQSGQTYYYVVTAVDSSNRESSYSNQSSATIPTP
jgi:fibronectin type 3 domain-containing protein